MTPAAIRISIAATALVSIVSIGGALYYAWPRADAAPARQAALLPHAAVSIPGEAAAPRGGDLVVLTERLAHRLTTRDTEDGEGWALLGRSYAVLGRNDDALAAFERARRLLGDTDAQLAMDHAAAKAAAGVSRRAMTGSASLLAR